PRSDLHTRAVFAPRADDSIAALSPAPPAPTTSTSCSCCSYLFMLSNNSNVCDRARGCHPDVEIGKPDREQARPGPEHMLLGGGEAPRPQAIPQPAQGSPRERIEPPSDQMPERMA